MIKGIGLKFLCSLLAVIFSTINCSQVTIVGSKNVLQSPYKAYVTSSGLKANETVIVALTSNKNSDTQFFKLKSENGSLAEEISFNLTGDLQDAYKLTSIVIEQKKSREICSQDTSIILGSAVRRPLVLIQTDKPIYKPTDKVRFQVLVLDSNTIPYDYENIQVNVVDSKGNTVRKINGTRSSEFGVFKGSVSTSNEPNLGEWKLEVFVNNSTEKTTKTFNIEKYETPPFTLFVETNPALNFDEGSVRLKIYAKNSYNQIINGTARIKALSYYQSNPQKKVKESPVKEVDISGDKEVVELRLKSDLKFNFLVKNLILNIEVEFEEKGSKKKAKQSRRVIVLVKGKNYIKLSKPEFFYPGYTYSINAIVEKLDGTLDMRTGEPLKLSVKYNPSEGKEFVQHEFLKNGKARFNLKPSEKVESITIKFEFDGSTIEEKILPLPAALNSNFVKVTSLTEQPQVGSPMQILVESNSFMEELNVAVLGKSGLVFSQQFNESKDQNLFNFTLPVTEKMVPDANIIVYYLTEDEFIHGHINIKLGFNVLNHFNISAVTEELSGKVAFKIFTDSNSYVSLLALDKSVTYVGKHNEINDDDIAEEIRNLNKFKINEESSEFNKINTVVLQPSKGGSKICKESEVEFLNEQFNSNPSIISQQKEDFKIPEIDFEDANNATEVHIRKYFPNVWFFEGSTVNESTKSFIKQLPDSSQSWIVSGFSLSRTKGLDLTVPIEVGGISEDFSVTVNVPPAAKVGEVVDVKISVYNQKEGGLLTANITLDINNMEFEFVDQTVDKKKCIKYGKLQFTSRRLTLKVSSKSSEKGSFLIRLLKPGNTKVNVKVSSGLKQQEVLQNINVHYEGILQRKSNSMVIDLRNTSNFEESILPLNLPNTVQRDNVKVKISVSGNMFGPIIDNINDLSNFEGSGEQKMKNFAFAIYSYKYMKLNGNFDKKLLKDSLEVIYTGYQEILAMKGDNGTYNLWPHLHKNTDSIWLTAYVTQLLIDASEFIDVDEDLIYKSLEYLKDKQKSDGSFDDEDGFNFRENHGAEDSRNIRLTSFVIITFAQSEKFKEEYDKVIKKGKEYLKDMYFDSIKKYDYEYVMMAYATVLADEVDFVKNATAALKRGFIDFGETKLRGLHLEVIAYAILVNTKLNNMDQAMKDFVWFFQKRKIDGTFISTHDSVLGVKALYSLAEKLGPNEPNVEIQINNAENNGKLSINSAIETKNLDFQYKHGNLQVKAKGSGLIYATVSYEYRNKDVSNNMIHPGVEARETSNGISIHTKFLIQNTRYTSIKQSNMIVYEVNLPSGYEFDKVHPTGVVQKADVRENENVVLLYTTPLSTSITTLNITANRIHDVEDLKSYFVRVYDLYDPTYYTNVQYELKWKKCEDTKSKGRNKG